MSRWLPQISRKKNQKTKQLWEKEFNIVEEGLDEEQVITFVNDLIAHRNASLGPIRQSEQKATPDSVRSIIERAVKDAEQIAAGIKAKAQTEAEQIAAGIMAKAQTEAVKIIDKAKEATEEIRRHAETTTRKQSEEVLAALNAKTQLIEKEAKQKVESLLLQARQEIEKQVREEYQAAHSRLLHSLVRGAGEVLPSAEAPAPVQSEPKIIPASQPEAKPAFTVETQKKGEEAQKPKMPASGQKGKLSGLLNMRLGKKAEETKEPEMPASSQKGKLSRLLNIRLGKKAEQAKENDKTGKQTSGEANLVGTDKAKNQTEEAKSAASAGAIKKMQPVQPEKEAPLPEPAQSIARSPTEKPPAEKKPGKQEPVGAPQKLDRAAIYDGEIELAITVPIDPAAVSKLYNYLQSTPDMKILYTRGSWYRGTTITVALDKPLPIIDMISKISGLTIAPGLPQKEKLVNGTSSSLLGAKRTELTRVDLILKVE